MKIRNSFVSNSSSASFIISVKEDPENFYKMLYDNSEMFCGNTIYKKFQDFSEYFLKNTQFHKDNLAKEVLSCLPLFEVYDKYIYLIPKENLARIMELYFKSSFHFLKKNEDSLTIEHCILMYNDFDSFSKMTKELIYLLTVSGMDFTWKIEEDDDVA